MVREGSANKEHQYRLSKRLTAINTHDLYKQKTHKGKLIIND